MTKLGAASHSGMIKPQKVIIDTDPGQDDMLAILMAAMSDAIEVVAITTVSGNAPVEHTTQNALNIIEAIDLDVPVHAGAANPLKHRYGYPHQFHGVTGLGTAGATFPEAKGEALPPHAAQAIIDLVDNAPGEITIVALAPMTNLALALMLQPEIATKIKAIVFMGGGLDRGNVTPAAEFNIWADAEAAALVFEAGVPLVMFGLNVTERAILPAIEVEKIASHLKGADPFVDATRFYFETYYKFVGPGSPGAPIHDVCPIAYMLNPELFHFRNYPVEVITEAGPTYGMTLADRRERDPASDDRRQNVQVAVDGDFAKLALLTASALRWGSRAPTSMKAE